MKPEHYDRDTDNYLRRLRWALSVLPDADISEVVEETRSHILERLDGGATFDEVRLKLGPADNYARQFVRDYCAANAISTRKTDDLLSALVVNAPGNLLVVIGVGLIFAMWAVVLGFSAVAVMKIFNPATIGLWSNEKMLFLGIIDDPGTAKELLGIWIFPVAFSLVAIAWAVTRRIAVSLLARTARQA